MKCLVISFGQKAHQILPTHSGLFEMEIYHSFSEHFKSQSPIDVHFYCQIVGQYLSASIGQITTANQFLHASVDNRHSTSELLQLVHITLICIIPHKIFSIVFYSITTYLLLFGEYCRLEHLQIFDHNMVYKYAGFFFLLILFAPFHDLMVQISRS